MTDFAADLVKRIPKTGVVVAIDGPAGTGKSSATKRLAERLGFTHVDTGALYRSIGWWLKQRGEESNETRAAELARVLKIEFKRIPYLNPSNRVFIEGEDRSEAIRTPEVSLIASQISAIPEVRSALLELQRRMGASGGAILEGRDIGTVIFPDADVKFFLTASVEERAKRRLSELEALGKDVPSFEEVRQQIETRDSADRNRKVAPLKQAVDSILIDTSELTLDEVVDRMAKQVMSVVKRESTP